jgi:hypothetical protein
MYRQTTSRIGGCGAQGLPRRMLLPYQSLASKDSCPKRTQAIILRSQNDRADNQAGKGKRFYPAKFFSLRYYKPFPETRALYQKSEYSDNKFFPEFDYYKKFIPIGTT